MSAGQLSPTNIEVDVDSDLDLLFCLIDSLRQPRERHERFQIQLQSEVDLVPAVLLQRAEC